VRLAPPEYRKNYASMPYVYKMNRVEYRLDNKHTQPYAEKKVSEFFSGLEYACSPEEVTDRIYSFELDEPTEAEPEKTKFCIMCGNEEPDSVSECGKCRSRSFVSSYAEYQNIKLKKQLEEQEKRIKELQDKQKTAQSPSYTSGNVNYIPSSPLRKPDKEKKAPSAPPPKEPKIPNPTFKGESPFADMCKICGGRLTEINDSTRQCVFCGSVFVNDTHKPTPAPSDTKYLVRMKNHGSNKLSVINVVRTYLKTGLKEAKDITESCPVILGSDMSISEAERFASELKHHGATVSVEPCNEAPGKMSTPDATYTPKAPTASGAKYTVSMHKCGPKKLDVIKIIRLNLGISLTAAKDIAESCPVTLKSGLDKNEADAFAKELRDAGATISVDV